MGSVSTYNWYFGPHSINGNSRILKWRYCTIFQAIFWGDVPLHRPYIGLIYGRYLHFRILKFPLIIVVLFWARLANFQSLAHGSLVQVTGVQLDIVSRKSQRQKRHGLGLKSVIFPYLYLHKKYTSNI